MLFAMEIRVSGFEIFSFPYFRVGRVERMAHGVDGLCRHSIRLRAT